jgi:hypothetical protein
MKPETGAVMKFSAQEARRVECPQRNPLPDDWGGHSLAGVLAVHCLSGLLLPGVIIVRMRRRRAAGRAGPQPSSRMPGSCLAAATRPYPLAAPVILVTAIRRARAYPCHDDGHPADFVDCVTIASDRDAVPDHQRGLRFEFPGAQDRNSTGGRPNLNAASARTSHAAAHNHARDSGLGVGPGRDLGSSGRYHRVRATS